MGIDFAAIPMQALGLLAGLTFVSSLIGHSLTRNAFVGAIITVIIFVLVYVFWNYYPHPSILPNVRFPG
jgi:preprotein translocase subunit SecF